MDDLRALIAESEIVKQLQRNFREDDQAGILDRRRKLRQAFESVPRRHAARLLARLMDKNDPLARLFGYKIATATRQEMISILMGKSSQPA